LNIEINLSHMLKPNVARARTKDAFNVCRIL
jgi:hypothetical protein